MSVLAGLGGLSVKVLSGIGGTILIRTANVLLLQYIS
jgi:hypothetical protein